MRKLLLLAVAGLFCTSAAHADFTGKDASAATITFKNPNVCTSVACIPVFQLTDPTGVNGAAVPTAGADAQSNTANGLLTYSRNVLWNGTTWDRWTGDLTSGGWVNVKTSVLPTGAATAAGLTTINTTLGTPFQAGGSIGNTTFAATQSGVWNVTNISGTVSLPTGASTSALQTTGNTALTTINTTLGTPMQQTGGSVAPSTLAAWGLVASTQNGATPTNGQLAMAQFNTTPTTVTTGNVSPLQMDAAGNLLVNIKAGAGSGGTAIADNAAFTQGTTSETPAGCLYNTAYANATTAHSTVVRCTITGDIFTNIDSYAGTALTGTVTAYGTAPTGNVFGVNAFVTNSNANGQATAANSSPVVLPALQVAAQTQGSTTSGQSGELVQGAVTTATPSYTTAQTSPLSMDVNGNTRVVLGGGIPITASATGTTTATTATLATSASVTTYICGFSIRANATAAATNNATVTGVITGTMNFTQWTAPLASGIGVTEETFTPCVPASAANTSIAVVSGAPGSGGVVSVSAWGYQQ